MNTNTTAEISFTDAVATMTDGELARYAKLYRTKTDSISRIHATAVRIEIARRSR